MGLTPAALAALFAGCDSKDQNNFLAAATPGGIEAQEVAGQKALCESSHLPKEMHPNREAFEALGFVIGEPVDDLFVNVTFPAGWRYEVTDHNMWSKVLDGEGKERVAVFYKAAFYDRRANCRIVE